jgi:DNA repair exonuclease SbcCD ATPase subunit
MKICFDSLKKKSPLKHYILQPLMPIFSNLMNKYFPVLWGSEIKGETIINQNNNVEFNIHKGKSAKNYKSASSGECRIVDIAALLSFIEFAGILNRTTLGFMVIDEILESLDKVLALRVLNLMKNFAVSKNVQILFITNNPIIIESQEKYGLFDRELIFQKQNGITKLIENREEVIEFDDIKTS